MAMQRLLSMLVVCAAAFAADLHVAITPGQVAERRIPLSKEELRKEPLLWIQAHPEQIVVSVNSPDGRVYAGTSRDENTAVLIQFADRKSSSQDEVSLAQSLGGNATLVRWSQNAPPGTYTIRIAARGLSSPVQVTLRQMTSDALGKAIDAQEKAQENKLVSSLYAAPERRVRVDAQGNASLKFTGAWHKDDLILIGSTLKSTWKASVRFPDGTAITEANAQQSGCEWTDAANPDEPGVTPLDWTKLSVSCPQRMKSGSIAITLRAAKKGADGQLIAAIFRASALEAALEKESGEFTDLTQTVALIHKADAPSSVSAGYLSAIVDRPGVIRLALQGGASPVREVTVTRTAYIVDRKSDFPLRIFGPHPSKKAYATVANIAREPDGDFIYNFTAHDPGTHQLDFEAEGVFQNGRRFAAQTIVTVIMHRRAASLTSIRQQRLDRNNAGKPDLARFVLDLDVAEPGRYTMHIQVGDEANQTATAYAEMVLQTGKQALVVDGNAQLLKKLEESPSAQLNVSVVNWNRRADGDFPSQVAIDTAIPKAGEFEAPAPPRSGATGAGATWRISDSDLVVTVPINATGTGCQWSATLEINPGQIHANELIRTLGYRQNGTFVPQSGKASIDTRWNLSPFFATSPPPEQQAFVFRLKVAGCGNYHGSVENYERNSEQGGDVYVMRFTADLAGLQLAPLADSGNPRIPRVSRLATLEPLDKDGDGKFDHLKASFDLVSPGGTCLWRGVVVVEGSSSNVETRAETKPGVNRVSMELDVTTSLSLRDHPVFRFWIDPIKCGIDPAFTRDETEVAPRTGILLFEQQFIVDLFRFAGQGEFKPR